MSSHKYAKKQIIYVYKNDGHGPELPPGSYFSCSRHVIQLCFFWDNFPGHKKTSKQSECGLSGITIIHPSCNPGHGNKSKV